MAKIVTMGEIMLRLSTPNNEKFIQADEFDINYGGGEANVAVSLANYGHDTQFVTAVPANRLASAQWQLFANTTWEQSSFPERVRDWVSTT